MSDDLLRPSLSSSPSGERYQLRGELGRGGMGAVYRAFDTREQREVALKILLDAALQGTDGMARFLREAQATSELDHPGIIHVHDVGKYSGKPYIAMELIEGESFAQLLKRKERLEPRELARIVRDVARAVAHAHAEGFIHRDIKPGNVLLDKEGQTHLGDFGLVRILGANSLTKTGEILGTPGYMAPEQASGEREKHGPASDVYSLGAMLYRGLTGRAPFEGQSLTQVLLRDVPAIQTLEPTADPELSAIAMRCLARDPNRRPLSAGLADELERYVAKSRVVSKRGSRVLLAVVGLVVLAGLSVGGTLLVLGPRPAPPPTRPATPPTPPPPPPKPAKPSPAGDAPLRFEALWTIDAAGHVDQARSQPLVADDRGSALALDAKNHRLFAALGTEGRVFVYALDPKTNALQSGDPLAVIGQKDFETIEHEPVKERIQTIRGLAYDAERDLLYVCDADRSRFLVYKVGDKKAVTKPVYLLGKVGQDGRPNYEDRYAFFGVCGFWVAAGVAVDAECVYAVGTNHDRVNVFSMEQVQQGMARNAAIAAVCFLGRLELRGEPRPAPLPVSARSLASPSGIACGLGWLFVADQGADRVLGYRLPLTRMGQPAELVLGQDDFESQPETTNPSARNLKQPTDIAVDTTRKRVYVVDSGFRRVLGYDLSAEPRTTVEATTVLGQKSFGTYSNDPLDTLSQPRAIAVDPSSGRVFVGDGRTGAITTFAPGK